MKKYSWLMALIAIFALAFAGFVSCGGSDDGPKVAVTGVTLDKASHGLALGATLQLEATVAPEDATNKKVTWESSDPTVATVSNAGLVTAVAVGSALIVVTTDDGGFDAECTINVYPEGYTAVTGVTLNKTTLTLVQTETETLIATVAPEDAHDKSGTWSSGTPAVATVSQTGLVTAVSAGEATITFTTTDGQKTASCVVTVSGYPIFVGGTEQLNIEPHSSVDQVTAPSPISAALAAAADNYWLRVVVDRHEYTDNSATIVSIGDNNASRLQVITRVHVNASTGKFIAHEGDVNATGTLLVKGHVDFPMNLVKANLAANGGDFKYQLASAGRGRILSFWLMAPCDGSGDCCEPTCLTADPICMCPGCFTAGPGTGVQVEPHRYCVCCIPGPYITINTQPASSTTVESDYTGQSLTVAATLNYPNDPGHVLSYQWYSNDTSATTGGTPVGVNSATYNIPDGLAVAEHFFYVVISGPDASPVTSNSARFNVEAEFVAKGFNLASYITAQGDNFVNYTTTSITGIDSWLGNNVRISSSSSGYPPLYTSSGTDTTTLVLVNKVNNSLMARHGNTSSNNLNIRIGSTNGIDLDLINRRYSVTVAGTGLVTGGQIHLQFNGFDHGLSGSGDVPGTYTPITASEAFNIGVELPLPPENPGADGLLRIVLRGTTNNTDGVVTQVIITTLTITDIGPRNP